MICLADGTLECASVSASVRLQATETPIVTFDNCNFVVSWHRVDATIFCFVVAVTKGARVGLCCGAV